MNSLILDNESKDMDMDLGRYNFIDILDSGFGNLSSCLLLSQKFNRRVESLAQNEKVILQESFCPGRPIY